MSYAELREELGLPDLGRLECRADMGGGVVCRRELEVRFDPVRQVCPWGHVHWPFRSSLEGWAMFDTRTNRRASTAGFCSRERAELMIDLLKAREARGGRPDVTAQYLEARRTYTAGRIK